MAHVALAKHHLVNHCLADDWKSFLLPSSVSVSLLLLSADRSVALVSLTPKCVDVLGNAKKKTSNKARIDDA